MLTKTPNCGIVVHDIIAERWRQIALRNGGRFPYTLADSGMSDEERLAALGEEFGEVCRALLEHRGSVSDTHHMSLRTELVQVAAVCVAWIEHLDNSHHQNPIEISDNQDCSCNECIEGE